MLLRAIELSKLNSLDNVTIFLAFSGFAEPNYFDICDDSI